MFYTYLLKLSNGNYYAGHSSNLRYRYKQHQKGLIQATKNYLPIKLVFYAAFMTLELAVQFEKYLKTNSGFAFRNKHFLDR